MAKAAVVALKSRKGASRQKIKAYILANYKVTFQAYVPRSPSPVPSLSPFLNDCAPRALAPHTSCLG